LKNQYNELLSKIPLGIGTSVNDDPLLYTIPPLMNANISIGVISSAARDIRDITVNKTIYNEFLRTINYTNVPNSSLTIKNEYKDLLRGKQLEFNK
jgi:hypothetical protein